MLTATLVRIFLRKGYNLTCEEVRSGRSIEAGVLVVLCLPGLPVPTNCFDAYFSVNSTRSRKHTNERVFIVIFTTINM